MKKGYFCNICGYSPYNRADWCELGCGRDYNEMIAVPQKLIDKLIAVQHSVEPITLQVDVPFEDVNSAHYRFVRK